MKAFDQSPAELREFLGFLEEDLENVRRVMDTLEEEDVDTDFVVHAKAETVEESAENTEIEKSQVIKTLVLVADEPVAVLCPGDRRVDLEKVAELRGVKEARMAYPREVEESTDYRVGGVSPFDLEIPVYAAEEILEKEVVKPAAGSRVVGVEIDAGELLELTGAEVSDVTEE